MASPGFANVASGIANVCYGGLEQNEVRCDAEVALDANAGDACFGADGKYLSGLLFRDRPGDRTGPQVQ